MQLNNSEHARGFTVVEVIIAALVVVVVGAGVTTAVMHASAAERSRAAADFATNTAERFISTARSSNAWMTTTTTVAPNNQACPTTTVIPGSTAARPALSSTGSGANQSEFNDANSCRLFGGQCDTANPALPCIAFSDATLHDPQSGVEFTLDARARGFDLADDGTGNNDTDGIVPDEYRVIVTLTPINTSAMKQFTVTAQLRIPKLSDFGSVQGSLCRITGQTDARETISECPQASQTATGDVRRTLASGSIDPVEHMARLEDQAYICAHPDLATKPYTISPNETYGFRDPAQYPNACFSQDPPYASSTARGQTAQTRLCGAAPSYEPVIGVDNNLNLCPYDTNYARKTPPMPSYSLPRYEFGAWWIDIDPDYPASNWLNTGCRFCFTGLLPPYCPTLTCISAGPFNAPRYTYVSWWKWPIQTAHVTLTGLDAANAGSTTTTTDANGEFTFNKVRVGRYRITVNTTDLSQKAPNAVLWNTKSVPGDVFVVERGFTSRVVRVYKPRANQSYSVSIMNVDASMPWDADGKAGNPWSFDSNSAPVNQYGHDVPILDQFRWILAYKGQMYKDNTWHCGGAAASAALSLQDWNTCYDMYGDTYPDPTQWDGDRSNGELGVDWKRGYWFGRQAWSQHNMVWYALGPEWSGCWKSATLPNVQWNPYSSNRHTYAWPDDLGCLRFNQGAPGRSNTLLPRSAGAQSSYAWPPGGKLWQFAANGTTVPSMWLGDQPKMRYYPYLQFQDTACAMLIPVPPGRSEKPAQEVCMYAHPNCVGAPSFENNVWRAQCSEDNQRWSTGWRPITDPADPEYPGCQAQTGCHVSETLNANGGHQGWDGDRITFNNMEPGLYALQMTRYNGFLYYPQNSPGFVYISEHGWTVPQTSPSWKAQGRAIFEFCHEARRAWAMRMFDYRLQSRCKKPDPPGAPTPGTSVTS